MAFHHLNRFITKGTKTLRELQDRIAELKKGQEIAESKPVRIPKEKEIQVVAISPRSVAMSAIAILLVALGAYALYSVIDLLLLLFLGLFFAATLDPGIDWLQKRHIPRWAGVILLFLVGIAGMIVIVGSVVPIIIEQISEIATSIGTSAMQYFQAIQNGTMQISFLGTQGNEMLKMTLQSLNLQAVTQGVILNLNELTQYLENFASGSFSAASNVVSAGVSAATTVANFFFQLTLVLFFTFFMVIDRDGMTQSFRNLFPARHSEYISNKIHAIQEKIGAWTRGQIALSFIMFMLGFAGLLLIDMKYAITIAMVLAIGEFLPYVGPILFLLFSLPIALNISLFMVIKLLILYAILQFIEGNIIVPVVMEKAVGLSPIITMIALLIGFQFLGIIGAIIAVPVATAIGIFIRDYMERAK